MDQWPSLGDAAWMQFTWGWLKEEKSGQEIMMKSTLVEKNVRRGSSEFFCRLQRICGGDKHPGTRGVRRTCAMHIWHSITIITLSEEVSMYVDLLRHGLMHLRRLWKLTCETWRETCLFSLMWIQIKSLEEENLSYKDMTIELKKSLNQLTSDLQTKDSCVKFLEDSIRELNAKLQDSKVSSWTLYSQWSCRDRHRQIYIRTDRDRENMKLERNVLCRNLCIFVILLDHSMKTKYLVFTMGFLWPFIVRQLNNIGV